jgi:hypothetical protein
LLELMVSSRNESNFLHKLNGLPLHMVFEASWALMLVGSIRPLSWNDSKHGPLWQFCFNY